MSKEGQPVLHFILSLARLVTPGDAVKDTLLAGGPPAAMIYARLDTAILFGVLNIVVVAAFRGLELYLKYGRKEKPRSEPESPTQD